jgi:predicted phage replisome organizer
MAENKKYYWLKLKRDFFKRHDIRIIEEMPNGKDYILFYLKLLLESIDHEGSLRFSDTIPYNEQMLSVVTNTNIDIVRSAMKLFIELNMMSVFDDQTIYMNEVDKLIGCETEWAKKKRLYRESMDKERTLSSDCPSDVPLLSDKSKSKSKSLEKEKEIDLDISTTTTTEAAPSLTEVYMYFRARCDEDATTEADKFHAYNTNRGWDCLPDWKATADLWIARIGEKRR